MGRSGREFRDKDIQRKNQRNQKWGMKPTVHHPKPKQDCYEERRKVS